MSVDRCLHLVGATGKIRTLKHDGRDHMVVPVVAMVEGVVWAVNAEAPEFVSAKELAETPQQWNGRRAFAGHPKKAGREVTANQPDVTERAFGTVFNTASRDDILASKRLTFDVYLDLEKAAALGDKEQDVVVRLNEGRAVEVSIGAHVEVTPVKGERNGQSYYGEWTNIVSDHIAFLAADERGACSIEAGCGAPRTAVRHLVTASGIEREEEKPMTVPKTVETPKSGGLRERIVSLLASLRALPTTDFLSRAMAEGNSDSDVRRALDAALRAVEPGYMGIECVYPDEQEVIYFMAPEDVYILKRRKYKMSEAGEAELTDEGVEVEPSLVYEPVTAEGAAPKTATAPCGCGRKAEERVMAKIDTARIKALMENEYNPMKDQKALEAASEESIAALETHCKTAAELKATADAAKAAKPEDKPEVKPEAKPEPLTKERVLAAFPDLALIVQEHTEREATERAKLVGQLKTAAGAAGFTDEQLDAMPVAELAKLARLAKVEAPADYSGRRFSKPVAADADEYKSPNPYDKGLEALRAKAN